MERRGADRNPWLAKMYIISNSWYIFILNFSNRANYKLCTRQRHGTVGKQTQTLSNILSKNKIYKQTNKKLKTRQRHLSRRKQTKDR
jgi:hypothetical protein